MEEPLAKKKLKEYIIKSRPVMEKYLDEQLENAKEFGDLQVEMVKIFKEMVSAGKGIRGFLITLMYEACGGTEQEKILDASTSIEMFHSAVLIQDDVMDRDDLRRGLPTAHTVFKKYGKDLGIRIPPEHYGHGVAICLGDVMLYLSWKILLESGFEHENILEASKVYYETVMELAMGQASDLTLSGLTDVEEDDVLKVIWTKSGKYTSYLPMLMGAALAGEKDQSKIEAIKNYAKNLGWAFHIQDDLLDTFGEQEILGKPIGSDLTEGRHTLLTLHLQKHGTKEQVEFLKTLLGKENITKEEFHEFKKVLKDAGSYDHVYNLGMNYVNEGKKYIPDITEDKELQEILESLIVYMMERVK